MTKAERHDAIRERARVAIQNLYHNATPKHPSLDDELATLYYDWFTDAARFEIEYIESGGAYGNDYRSVLVGNAAVKCKSKAARDYYVRSGMYSYLENRQGWERIGEYGKLYQWGRGGRTLAPDKLVKPHGGSSFSMREDYADEMRIAAVVELIAIVESFNSYVETWCRGVPEMWADYYQENHVADVDEMAELSTTD